MKSNRLWKIGSLILLGLIASSTLVASQSDVFVRNILTSNGSIAKVIDVRTVSTSMIDKRWSRDVVRINFITKDGERHEQFLPILTDGAFYSEHVYDVDGKPIADRMVLSTDELYKKSALIFAPEDESKIKNRVAIFSDFQCPYCNRTAPKKLKEMFASGDTAIYYYNFPISSIHPNSALISMCAITAMEKYPKRKLEVPTKMYESKAFQYENGEPQVDLKSILNKFNVVSSGTRITLKDVEKFKAKELLEIEITYSSSIGVTTVPTTYKNGEIILNTKG
jgi:protein-disulfide isomerase